MRVLVAYEKHSTRLLDASTDEALAISALRLLRERWDSGYWYYAPDDDDGEPPYTDEQVAAMPEGSQARQMAEGELRRWHADAKRRADRKQWWAAVEELLAMPEEEALARQTKMFTGRLGRDANGGILSPMEAFPTAWAALKFRREAEYENVALEDVEAAVAEEVEA